MTTPSFRTRVGEPKCGRVRRRSASTPKPSEEQPGSCGQIRQSRGGTMTRRAGGDPAGAKPICKEGEKARITSSGLPGRPRLEDTGAGGEVRSHEIDSLRQ